MGVKIGITDNIELVKNAASENIERALEKIGLVAERYAKENCPVDTGRLRNSITHQVSGLEVYIGTNVEYAPYVELGALGRDPKPYLKPAVENHIGEYQKIIEGELGGTK